MSVDEFIRQNPKVAITAEQLACCHYLERQGKRFLIDFGYQNAPDLAWAEIDAASSIITYLTKSS